MAQKIEISLALVIVAMLWAGATAQSSCTNVIVSMSPCLNYITGNSSTPSSGCCSQLARVVRSQPQCLCEVLNGGSSSLGININKSQALALPAACNVQTPPLSRCNGNGGSSTDSPAETPNSSKTVPSGSRSKTIPTTEDGSSYGNSIKISTPLLLFTILAATYVSSY